MYHRRQDDQEQPQIAIWWLRESSYLIPTRPMLNCSLVNSYHSVFHPSQRGLVMCGPGLGHAQVMLRDPITTLGSQGAFRADALKTSPGNVSTFRSSGVQITTHRSDLEMVISPMQLSSGLFVDNGPHRTGEMLQMTWTRYSWKRKSLLVHFLHKITSYW